MVMRLDKLLAHYGIGTRKEVKNYIRKGFVTVNGSIIKKDDFKVDYETDKIIFDGKLETISFGWRTFSVIIWILILYNGGFWN